MINHISSAYYSSSQIITLPSTMHLLTSIGLLLHILHTTNAAGACQKDACYTQVAALDKTLPGLASRKADCSIALRKVADAKTTTITKFSTVFPVTRTITVNSVRPSPQVVARDELPDLPVITTSPDPETAELERRAQVIATGTKPAYAKSCKNIQSYAVACLCMGVKAATNTMGLKTATTTKTVSATKTATFGFDYVSYLKNEGQGFCSSYIQYVPGAATVTGTLTAEITPIVTMPTTILETVSETTVQTITFTAGGNPGSVPRRRRGWNIFDHSFFERGLIAPNPTPASVRGMVASQLSSLCSAVATGVQTVSVSHVFLLSH